MRRAFTVTELLVVLAIFALLAALLMPAISEARASARSAACMSHQAQLADALNNYASDHFGLFAPNRMHLPDNTARDAERVIWWFGGEPGGPHPSSMRHRPLDKSASPLARYLGDNIQRGLRCPDFPADHPRFFPKFEKSSAHYGYNESLAPLWFKQRPPMARSQVPAPSEVFAFADAVHVDGFNYTEDGEEMFYEPHYAQHSRYPGFRTGFGHFRHDGGANLVMVDGHTEQVRRTEPVYDMIAGAAAANLDDTWGRHSVYGNVSVDR